MKVEIAFDKEETRQISFQDKFPEEAECLRCDGKARLGFVAEEHSEGENPKGGKKYVCQIYKNKPNEMWLHDACVVAVYFCKKCLEPVALYNQA